MDAPDDVAELARAIHDALAPDVCWPDLAGAERARMIEVAFAVMSTPGVSDLIDRNAKAKRDFEGSLATVRSILSDGVS